MAVTYNIKGTTNSSFKVGKTGTGTVYLNTLSAVGNEVHYEADTTTYLKIINSSGSAVIRNSGQDKDISFVGNDGGSTITALTLDMSEEGDATFNGKIITGDTELQSGAKTTINTGTNIMSVEGSSNGMRLFVKNGGVEGFSAGSEGGLGHGAIALRGQTILVGGNSSKGFAFGRNVSWSDVNALGQDDLKLKGDVQVTGNLTVQGTTTSVSSATIEVKDKFVFEGATDDAHELTLQAADPTSDRTVTIPDETGILIVKNSVTGMIQLPVGTSAERPTPSAGMLRFNTTINRFEGYNGTGWVPMSPYPNDLTSRDGDEVQIQPTDLGSVT